MDGEQNGRYTLALSTPVLAITEMLSCWHSLQTAQKKCVRFGEKAMENAVIGMNPGACCGKYENTQKLHSIFQDRARSIRIATWTVLCLLWNCITQKPCNNLNCVDVCRDKSAIITLICLYICTLSQCILVAVFLLSIWWYTPPNDWLYSIPVTDSIQACTQFWNPFSRFCLWNCCV